MEVYGRADNIVDFIGFRTSKGTVIEAGGPGGLPFSYRVSNTY